MAVAHMVPGPENGLESGKTGFEQVPPGPPGDNYSDPNPTLLLPGGYDHCDHHLLDHEGLAPHHFQKNGFRPNLGARIGPERPGTNPKT